MCRCKVLFCKQTQKLVHRGQQLRQLQGESAPSVLWFVVLECLSTPSQDHSLWTGRFCGFRFVPMTQHRATGASTKFSVVGKILQIKQHFQGIDLHYTLNVTTDGKDASDACPDAETCFVTSDKAVPGMVKCAASFTNGLALAWTLLSSILVHHCSQMF